MPAENPKELQVQEHETEIKNSAPEDAVKDINTFMTALENAQKGKKETKTTISKTDEKTPVTTETKDKKTVDKTPKLTKEKKEELKTKEEKDKLAAIEKATIEAFFNNSEDVINAIYSNLTKNFSKIGVEKWGGMISDYIEAQKAFKADWESYHENDTYKELVKNNNNTDKLKTPLENLENLIDLQQLGDKTKTRNRDRLLELKNRQASNTDLKDLKIRNIDIDYPDGKPISEVIDEKIQDIADTKDMKAKEILAKNRTETTAEAFFTSWSKSDYDALMYFLCPDGKGKNITGATEDEQSFLKLVKAYEPNLTDNSVTIGKASKDFWAKFTEGTRLIQYTTSSTPSEDYDYIGLWSNESLQKNIAKNVFTDQNWEYKEPDKDIKRTEKNTIYYFDDDNGNFWGFELFIQQKEKEEKGYVAKNLKNIVDQIVGYKIKETTDTDTYTEDKNGEYVLDKWTAATYKEATEADKSDKSKEKYTQKETKTYTKDNAAWTFVLKAGTTDQYEAATDDQKKDDKIDKFTEAKSYEYTKDENGTYVVDKEWTKDSYRKATAAEKADDKTKKYKKETKTEETKTERSRLSEEDMRNGYANVMNDFIVAHPEMIVAYSTYLTTANMNLLGYDNTARQANFRKLLPLLQSNRKSLDKETQTNIQAVAKAIEITKDKQTIQETIKKGFDFFVKAFGPLLMSFFKLFWRGKADLKDKFGAMADIDKYFETEYALSDEEKKLIDEKILVSTDFDDATEYDKSKPWILKDAKTIKAKLSEEKKTKYIQLLETTEAYKYIDQDILQVGLEAYNADKDTKEADKIATLDKVITVGEANPANIKLVDKTGFEKIMNAIMKKDDIRSRIAAANLEIVTDNEVDEKVTGTNEQGIDIDEARANYSIRSEKDVVRYLTAALFSNKDLSYVISESNLKNAAETTTKETAEQKLTKNRDMIKWTEGLKNVDMTNKDKEYNKTYDIKKFAFDANATWDQKLYQNNILIPLETVINDKEQYSLLLTDLQGTKKADYENIFTSPIHLANMLSMIDKRDNGTAAKYTDAITNLNKTWADDTYTVETDGTKTITITYKEKSVKKWTVTLSKDTSEKLVATWTKA